MSLRRTRVHLLEWYLRFWHIGVGAAWTAADEAMRADTNVSIELIREQCAVKVLAVLNCREFWLATLKACKSRQTLP